MNLRWLVEAEGWSFVEDPDPGRRSDALGAPQKEPLCWAQACKGNVLAVRPEAGIDAVYAASHEIAEARIGFEHGENLWQEQATILTRWCKLALIQGEHQKRTARLESRVWKATCIMLAVVSLLAVLA